MVESTPSRSQIHAEMERARREFHSLMDRSTPDALARPSNGTCWTNRQLLFHMLFGYLVTRDLRIIVKCVTRLPLPFQAGFARLLDAATRPFDQINYLGSCAGARMLTNVGMSRWFDHVIASLHHHVDAESDAALRRSMSFPVRWDPYFVQRMSLADLYHYATLHFDHHRRQLVLADEVT